MYAHVGDWLVVPPDPHGHHGRRGLILEVLHGDGAPPYRVRWLDDDHVSIVFPPPDSSVQSATDQHTGRPSAPVQTG